MIGHLTTVGIRPELHVTSEDDAISSSPRDAASNEASSMLIRLATANEVDCEIANERIGDFVQQTSAETAIVLSCRESLSLPVCFPPGAWLLSCAFDQGSFVFRSEPIDLREPVS